MNRRILSAILAACLVSVWSPDNMKGQSLDSILYLIDNDLIKEEAEKYDLLLEVIRAVEDPETRIRYCDQAIALAQKLDVLPALPCLKKGEAYLDSDQYASALEFLLKAVGYYEEEGNDGGLGRAYNLIAMTFSQQGNRENEKLYLQNAIKAFERAKDSISLVYTLHNLGYFNYGMGQYDTALVIFTESLDLFESINHSSAYFVCLGNLGLVHSGLGNFAQAEEFLLAAIDTLTSLGDKSSVPEFMTGYAGILQKKGDIDQAIAYASWALEITDNLNFKRSASGMLTGLYESSGRFDSAYYFQSIFIAANDSIKDIESVQRMANLRTEFEVGKKQDEVDILKRDRLKNRIINLGLGIILLLAVALVVLYYTNLKRSRKLTVALEERRKLLVKQSSELQEKNEKILNSNEELTVLNEAISKQNAQILESNEELTVLNEAVNRQKDEILDSITYAKKIQAAMLPPEQYLHEILNEVFVLFKPRDIVSGDFYWIKQVKNYVVLAAADCTGHGVPGAFMSLLGISFLNEIVQRREITQANQILNELRKQIRNSLRQHGQAEESKDGIDMALCVIDEKNRVLQYAGANNPMYLIREMKGAYELIEYKPDRMPLGYYQGRFKTFTNKDIQLKDGDVVYISSDGFSDQKGGKDNKKFMSKNFKDLLLKIHQEPMREQKKILEKTIADWMGDGPQIDDILVLGFRV